MAAEATDVIVAAVAVAAFAVSLLAASFSRRIAQASEDSAKAARDSADVARTVRDQNDAPKFNVVPQAPVKTVWPIEIEMISGPPSIQVHVSFMGETMKDENDGGAFGHMIGFQNRHSIQAAQGTMAATEQNCQAESARGPAIPGGARIIAAARRPVPIRRSRDTARGDRSVQSRGRARTPTHGIRALPTRSPDS